jgi:hypothetical protein
MGAITPMLQAEPSVPVASGLSDDHAGWPWETTPYRLWSLLAMLGHYFQFFKIALQLEALRSTAALLGATKVISRDSERFRELLDAIQRECVNLGLTHTAKLAARVLSRVPVDNYVDLVHELNHLADSLSSELEDESIFRIPPERKNYFERDDLFGAEVGAAFPSCARDIRKAGSCYALEQEDACVYHLMQVLERGLNALAGKFGVPFEYRNWQPIIGAVEAQIKLLHPGETRHLYQEFVAQFGFLKVAYRNHTAHVHEEQYDLDKALSILNHVREFMRALVKGGLVE